MNIFIKFFAFLLLIFHSALALPNATLKIHLHPIGESGNNLGKFPLTLLYNQQKELLYSNGNGTFKAKFNLPNDDKNSTTLLTLETPDFTQKTVQFHIRNAGSTLMKVSTDEYRMTMKSYVGDQEKTELNNLLGCHCVTKNCSCCMSVHLPHFQHTLCTNLTYNPQTIGLDISIGIDGFYYTQEISVRNPPPICFDVPGYKDIASLCVAFKKLAVTRKFVSGCVELEAELIHMRALHLHLGCFKMPI